MDILKRKEKLSGFTLIELSIVLVIISLIVGGIVGGKALIHSARIQDVMKGFSKMTTAFNTYELQFDALPGDHSNAQDYFGTTACPNGGGGTNPCNGNGSGKIAPVDGSEGSSFEDSRQIMHLMLADILVRDVEAWTDNGGGAMYKSSFGDDSDYLVLYIPNRSGHYIYFSDNGTSPTFYSRAVLTPKDAKAIDKKLDDGIPDSGNLQGERTGAYYYGGNDTERCSQNSAYRLDNTGPNCIISMKYR